MLTERKMFLEQLGHLRGLGGGDADDLVADHRVDLRGAFGGTRGVMPPSTFGVLRSV